MSTNASAEVHLVPIHERAHISFIHFIFKVLKLEVNIPKQIQSDLKLP